MDLGGEGEGQTRGAPSFTVGGSSSVPRSRGLGGQQRYAEEALVDDAGEGTVEAQRTGLLRRILHAMRCVLWAAYIARSIWSGMVTFFTFW